MTGYRGSSLAVTRRVVGPTSEALALALVALLALPPVAPGAVAPARAGTPTTILAPPGGAGSLAPADEATRARVEAGLGRLPLYFIENRGQLDSRVAYYVQGATNSVYFTKTGIVFALTSRVGEREDDARLLPAAFSPRRPGGEPPVVRPMMSHRLNPYRQRFFGSLTRVLLFD